MNKMQEIRIEKVTLNIGVGGPGENLDKGIKLLKTISGMKPVSTTTKKRIPTWSIRPGLEIGCKVTIRGKKGEEILKKLLQAKSNMLTPKNFDHSGNFSFGIKEYLDIPGVEYDMSIGIIGLEAATTLTRPGFRVKKRKIKPSKIVKHHLISKEEAMEFVKNKYSVSIGEENDY